MRIKSNVDMTTGNPTKQIILFGLPLLAGNLFQQLYNVIDTMLIGRFNGDSGLASIGAATPLNYLLNTLTIGMAVGFSIIIAQYFGAHKEAEQRKAVGNSIVLGLLIAIVMSAAAYLCIKPFFILTNTPESILQGAIEYVSIIALLQIFPVIYNLEAAFLRAVGNSQVPVFALILGLICNCGLDYLLIAVMGLGLAGAAYATILSQVFTAGFCFVYIWKQCEILHPRRDDFKLDKPLVRELLGMGLSVALTTSIVEIGTIVLQSAINSFGPAIISAHTASRRILSLATTPLGSMGTAAATFAGQNYGANKPKRIFTGLRSALVVSSAWAIFCVAAVYLFGSGLVRFLTGTHNQEIIQTSVLYLRTNFPFLIVLGLLFIMRQTLQAMSDKRTPVISGIIEMVMKVAVTYWLIPYLGYLGVCVTEPMTWVACTIMLVFSFLRNPYIKKTIRDLKQPTASETD